VEEEVERKVRAAAAAPAEGQSRGNGRQGGGGKDLTPTVEQLFGKDVAADVEAAGGPDKWARKAFGMSWNDYAKQAGGNA
jgi:hypothetical protein